MILGEISYFPSNNMFNINQLKFYWKIWTNPFLVRNQVETIATNSLRTCQVEEYIYHNFSCAKNSIAT
jgi:hypothetical protein